MSITVDWPKYNLNDYVFDRKRIDEISEELRTNKKIGRNNIGETMVLDKFKEFLPDLINVGHIKDAMDLYSGNYKLRIEVKIKRFDSDAVDGKFIDNVIKNPNDNMYLYINIANSNITNYFGGKIMIVDGYNLKYEGLKIIIDTLRSMRERRQNYYQPIENAIQKIYESRYSSEFVLLKNEISKINSQYKEQMEKIDKLTNLILQMTNPKSQNTISHELIEKNIDEQEIVIDDQGPEDEEKLSTIDEEDREDKTAVTDTQQGAPTPNTVTNQGQEIVIPEEHRFIHETFTVHQKQIDEEFVFYDEFCDEVRRRDPSTTLRGIQQNVKKYFGDRGYHVYKYQRRVNGKQTCKTIISKFDEQRERHGIPRNGNVKFVNFQRELATINLSRIPINTHIRFVPCSSKDSRSTGMDHILNLTDLLSIHKTFKCEKGEPPKSDGYMIGDTIVNLSSQLTYLRKSEPIYNFIMQDIYGKNITLNNAEKIETFLHILEQACINRVKFYQVKITFERTDSNLYSVLFGVRYTRKDTKTISPNKSLYLQNQDRIDEIMKKYKTEIITFSLHSSPLHDSDPSKNDAYCWSV